MASGEDRQLKAATGASHIMQLGSKSFEVPHAFKEEWF